MTAVKRVVAAHYPVLLGAVAFVAYWLTRAHAPTEWDSVQLVFGLDHFDVRQDSPHAPGYWGYVALGRGIRALTPLSGVASLTLASALASAVTVGLVAVLGRDLAGRWLGIAAAVIVGTTPFFWFYGSSIASYAFEALGSVVLMLLAWKAWPGSWHGIAAAGALGLVGGFRPTALIVLFPLAIVAALRANRTVRAWLLSAFAGAIAVAAWVVPMILEQPGGLDEIRHNNEVFWDHAASRTSIFSEGSEATHNFKILTAHMIAALGLVALLGVAALVVGLWKRNRAEPAGTEGARLTPVQLLLIAIIPPFAFMALFHFGKGGYLLALLPGAVLLALWPVVRLRPDWRILGTVGVAFITVFATQQFLWGSGALPGPLVDNGPWFTRRVNGAPFGSTRAVIEVSDRYQRVFDEMRERFDPDRDVIVYSAGNGGHWYRHAMYALPEFTIHYNDGADALTGRDQQYERGFDHVIEVPPGGDALFAVDLPTGEIADLQEQGLISPEYLDAGAGLWRVPPGVTLMGLTVEESDDAVDRPLVITSPPL